MSLEKFPSFFLNFSEADLSEKTGQSYSFSNFNLEVVERRLLKDGQAVALTPKAFEVLVFLVKRNGHLVEKQELISAVWPESFVEEANLARIIHTLRKVLGEDKGGEKFIETVAKKGYRFIAEVSEEVSIPAAMENNNSMNGESTALLQAEPPVPAGSISNTVSVNRSPTIAFVGLVAIVVTVSITAAWQLMGFRTEGSFSNRFTGETTSGEAHQLYTQGRLLVERRHKGDYEQALEHFNRAIELDPGYSKAYAAKADVKVVQFWGSSSHEDISDARKAVRRAIELDKSSSYAHTILCRILTTYDWDHKEAEKECRLAVELDPNDHEAQKELAFLLNSLGQEAEALGAMDRAIAIAPTSFNKRSRGLLLYHSRRYDDAIAQFQQVDQTDASYKETTRWLMVAHQMKKDYATAFEYYRKVLKQSGTADDEIAQLDSDFQSDGWNAVLRHIVAGPSLKTMFRAGAYAQLGETDLALETLEDMFKRRAVLLITSAREPTLDPIRSDPRFKDLMRRIALEK